MPLEKRHEKPNGNCKVLRLFERERLELGKRYPIYRRSSGRGISISLHPSLQKTLLLSGQRSAEADFIFFNT